AVRPERVPLSFAQQRLWFLEQFHGPGTAYNLPSAWRLDGRLDAGALAAGRPYQRVIDAVPELVVVAARPSELPDLLARATECTFDLASDLPVRVWLFTLGEQEHVLVLLCHHIASDGWSVQVLMADLAAAYAARREGRAPGWPDLPVQYADYTLWQRELLGGAGQDGADGGVLAGQVGYWRGALGGVAEELVLPADRPRPAGAAQRGGGVSGGLAGAAV